MRFKDKYFVYIKGKAGKHLIPSITKYNVNIIPMCLYVKRNEQEKIFLFYSVDMVNIISQLSLLHSSYCKHQNHVYTDVQTTGAQKKMVKIYKK